MTNAWTESRHGKVSVLTFERQPKNWMNTVSMQQLGEHLERIGEATDEVTAVMLIGGVDGYFIAHADLDDLAKIAKGQDVGAPLSAWARAEELLAPNPPSPPSTVRPGEEVVRSR